MSEFTFKQFTILQKNSAMKVGTDSVLLGCMAEVENVRYILDIGTGTGILALMCAQKSNAIIDAVEIDAHAAAEASDNFSNSKWHNRLTLHQQPIQLFTQTCNKLYDVIICNPPYYIKEKNYTIIDQQRSKARHDGDLPFNQLATNAHKLLHSNGSLWLIFPVNEADIFANTAMEVGLFLRQEITIFPKKNKPANRIIQQWRKQDCSTLKKEFVIYEPDGLPTFAYKNIAQHFYTGKHYEL